MLPDQTAFESVMDQKYNHIIHKNAIYNSDQYTLEVSQSAVLSFGRWVSRYNFCLKDIELSWFFSKMTYYIRHIASNEPFMFVFNSQICSLNINVILYPRVVEGVTRYSIYLSFGSGKFLTFLEECNALQTYFSDLIWQISREAVMIYNTHVPIVIFRYALLQAIFLRLHYMHLIRLSLH